MRAPTEFRGAARLGLGTFALTGGYGTLRDVDPARTVLRAFEAGWRVFDAADSYRGSEDLLGATLRPVRDDVFLATKVFPRGRYTAARLTAAVDRSLRRLRTDRIDLFQLHAPENAVDRTVVPTPAVELAASLNALLASGKVLRVGVSNHPSVRITELHRHVPLFSSQEIVNLYDRHTGTVVEHCAAMGLGVLAYSPLARGLLTDGTRTVPASDDLRARLPGFGTASHPRHDATTRLAAWAADHGRSVTELALAWVLGRPGVTVALTGAKTPEHVDLAARAADWTLTGAQRAEVENLTGDT
ncbi:aldo/keto reductase [Longispora urticae]